MIAWKVNFFGTLLILASCGVYSNANAQLSAEGICASGETLKECLVRPDAQELQRYLTFAQTLALQKSDIASERLQHCATISLLTTGFMELSPGKFEFSDYVTAVATKAAYQMAWQVEQNDLNTLPPVFSKDVMRSYLEDSAGLQSEWLSCLGRSRDAVASLNSIEEGAK